MTVTESVTVQVNDAAADEPASSVATTVTVNTPAVVGVPEITPDEGSMARPVGRSSAA